MKYLLSLLGILVAITLFTLISIWPDKHDGDSNAVVTINGKTLTKRFIQNHKDRDPHYADNKNYIETLVTKQLLIAEAQRRQIDQQPAFHLELKTSYENSLVELLLKEVSSEIESTVNAEEVNTYLEAFGKTYTFYILRTPQSVSIATIKSEGTKHASRFDDLGSTLRQSLASMNPGTVNNTYDSSNEKIAIYLEKIEGETNKRPNFDSKKIKNQLQHIKLEKQVNAWVENLRSQAAISYHINQE